MSSLSNFRKRVDALDEALLRLLNQRGKLVQKIGALKTRKGQSIFAPAREYDLLARLKKKNQGPLPESAVTDVFSEIVHACRSLQKNLKIAFFGPEGTFTHQAALKSFGRQAELVACRSIADVFETVEGGNADYGVVPIENSTEGIVNHTLDMFVESDLSICAELELPIHHYLLGRKSEYKAGRVEKLLSHYQAMAQCEHWLHTRPDAGQWDYLECSSTAEAARKAKTVPRSAAIASLLAAELYGLDVLESRLEDSKNNFTRFFVVGKDASEPTGSDKTSIMFSVKDRVGALYDILSPFKRFGLNMTKIESRPTRRKAWEYVFFVDFLGHQADRRVQKALGQLGKSCQRLKILGSYPRTE